MQALMLAAGMGRRLGKYTQARTKCMLKVGGRTLLERAVEALQLAGIRKFVVVVGWEHERLIQYIQENISGMEFEFVYNFDYAETNNIYSLYLAREKLAQDDTILLESDLVFDKSLIQRMVDMPQENLAAVAKYEQWMDGTVTVLSPEGTVQEFVEEKDFQYQSAESYFKTVNIYKFSKRFSCQQYIPSLEAYIAAHGKNGYYELVLKALVPLSHPSLKAFIMDDLPWYEIDDAQDLDIANTMFADERQRLARYENRYGGYWRFPGLTDFCYLVNPYFPTPKMLEQMQYFYKPLLTQYPSGMTVQKLMAGKMFNVNEDYLLVGNGAAELISILGRVLEGRLSIPVPAFNEYIRCFDRCAILELPRMDNDFQLDKNRLIDAAARSDILAVVNPDNPSGSFLEMPQMLEILDFCKRRSIRCIVDESFIDFAQGDKRYTLLSDNLLDTYPNLTVIKSISKSYGVPGLRLGALATADRELMGRLKAYMPIWNVNSFAEYFLQIFSLYADSYMDSCDKISVQRAKLQQRLETVKFLKVYPSQANFIMCRAEPPYYARRIAAQLLIQNNLFIKDLSQKHGFSGGQYIRVAVKSEEENLRLYQALKSLEYSEKT